jgi:hypothetical protein
MQGAPFRRCIILFSMASLAPLCFSTYSHKRTNNGKYFSKQNVCSEVLLFETFLILRRTERNIIIDAPRLLCNKYSLFFSHFKPFLNFLKIFSTNFQISKLMNIRLFGAEFFQAGRKKDVRIYKTDEAIAVFS